MTLFELLQTPLMKNAVVEHGNANLDSDVTWCSPDIALRFDNWIIPGLLLVYTGELEEQEFKNVYKHYKNVMLQESWYLTINHLRMGAYMENS